MHRTAAVGLLKANCVKSAASLSTVTKGKAFMQQVDLISHCCWSVAAPVKPSQTSRDPWIMFHTCYMSDLSSLAFAPFVANVAQRRWLIFLQVGRCRSLDISGSDRVSNLSSMDESGSLFLVLKARTRTCWRCRCVGAFGISQLRLLRFKITAALRFSPSSGSGRSLSHTRVLMHLRNLSTLV